MDGKVIRDILRRIRNGRSWIKNYVYANMDYKEFLRGDLGIVPKARNKKKGLGTSLNKNVAKVPKTCHKIFFMAIVKSQQ